MALAPTLVVVADIIQPIAAVPLTLSGKTDRKRLPLATLARRAPVVPPTTDVERSVFDVVAKGTLNTYTLSLVVLLLTNFLSSVVGVGASAMSIDDDFFVDLGGNSLLAAQVNCLLF